MKRTTRIVAIAASVLAIAVGGPALARLTVTNVGLTQGKAKCDGIGTFKYTPTWKNPSQSSSYVLQTGNQCKMAGRICGVSSKDCVVTCAPGATCTTEITGCVIGHASWVRVGSIDGYAGQQIVAPPPSYCRNGAE